MKQNLEMVSHVRPWASGLCCCGDQRTLGKCEVLGHAPCAASAESSARPQRDGTCHCDPPGTVPGAQPCSSRGQTLRGSLGHAGQDTGPVDLILRASEVDSEDPSAASCRAAVNLGARTVLHPETPPWSWPFKQWPALPSQSLQKSLQKPRSGVTFRGCSQETVPQARRTSWASTRHSTPTTSDPPRELPCCWMGWQGPHGVGESL